MFDSAYRTEVQFTRQNMNTDRINNFLKFSENLRAQKLIKFQNVDENSKISKTKSHFLFDSTWHKGLIYKAEYNNLFYATIIDSTSNYY